MIIIDSHKKLFQLWDMMQVEFNKHHYLKITMTSGNTRTSAQNRALHLWCGQLAETLNAAGIDLRTFYKEGVKIDWNTERVKEYVWKPIQKVVTKHSSTTKPTPEQYAEIYEHIARLLAENHGIVCEWPTNE